jgi:hypothetical protein
MREMRVIDPGALANVISLLAGEAMGLSDELKAARLLALAAMLDDLAETVTLVEPPPPPPRGVVIAGPWAGRVAA